MGDAKAVIQCHARRHAPAVLRIEIGLPVPPLAIDAIGPLLIPREVAEQRVRIAVARAQRIVAAVPEVVHAGISGRTGFCLGVAFRHDAELHVVAALGPRQVVLERVAVVLIPGRPRPRISGPWTPPRQIRAIAAKEEDVGHIRVFVDVDATQLRIAIRTKWLEPRRIEREVRTVVRRVIVHVERAGTDPEAVMVVREARAHLVDHRAAQHLAVRAAEEVAREHVVVRPDAGRHTVEGDAVVAIEYRSDAEPLTGAQHRVDAHDEVAALVDRRRVLCVVRGPLLTGRLVDDAVGQRQQIQHLLAHGVNPVLRDDVPRERLSRERIDDRLDCAVRHASLREVAPSLGVCWQVRPQHRGWPDIVDELLREEEEQFLVGRAAVEKSRNDHGAADAVARNVDFKEWFLRPLLLAEVVVRVPFVATGVVPGRSLQLVRARLGDNPDQAARLAAVLGGVAVGDDGDFADRIEVRRHVRRAIAAFFADRHTVNRRVLVE